MAEHLAPCSSCYREHPRPCHGPPLASRCVSEIDVFRPVVGATPPPAGLSAAPEGSLGPGGWATAPPPGDLAAASALMDASMAANTIRAYARDWRAWTAYAGAHGLQPLPAEPAHVCAFLAAYSTGRKATTTQRAAMAIGKAHRLAGLANPVDHEHVRRTLAGLRRTKGTAPRQARPLGTGDIQLLAAVTGDTLRGRRDRALLLVGYVGAFRRSELAALNAEDLEARPEGLLVHVRRSKTDPDGRGRHKTLPYAGAHPELCPVGAVRAWQQAAGIFDGPLWRPVHRNGHSLLDQRLGVDAIADIITRLAVTAGLDPDRITPHSLRAGHVTEAKRHDAPDLAVMNQTHHARIESLHGYVRDADPFRHTSAKFLGL